METGPSLVSVLSKLSRISYVNTNSLMFNLLNGVFAVWIEVN